MFCNSHSSLDVSFISTAILFPFRSRLTSTLPLPSVVQKPGNWRALWHHQDNILADFNGVIWHFRRGKQMFRYVLALFDIPDLVIAKYWPDFFHWLFAVFFRFCFWPFPENNGERLFALSNHCT